MFAMNWLAESNVIAPSWPTHSAGVVESLQVGRPKVLVAAKFALANQVMFVDRVIDGLPARIDLKAITAGERGSRDLAWDHRQYI